MNVKTFFAAIALVALAATSLSAQLNHQLGLTLGSNYSSLRSDLFPVASGRLSYAIGASFNLEINDRFGLNQEIIYTQKGASAQTAYFRPEQEPESRSYDYYYSTFETGIFAEFQPLATVPVRLQAGGFVGTHFHNLNRNNTELFVGDYGSINDATRAVDLNDAFSGIDLGPAAGISGGTGQFRVNARYYCGVRNLYNNLDFVESGHHIRTSSVRLTLTYFLK